MYSNKYDLISSRWCGKKYILEKKLGSGGIGEIFLARDEDGVLLALKCSKDVISITKEYSFLCKFKDNKFVPKVYILDDFIKDGEVYHYFSMEYIQGETLKSVIRKDKLSYKAKLDLICVITKIIKQINDEGYIYTDLKFENIMIDRKNEMIRLIDFGSLVKEGCTAKEFTPMYDRMCWKKGSRIADMSYQIFAMSILMIAIFLGRSIDPNKENLEMVLKKLKQDKFPRKLWDIINKSLQGKIGSCDKLYQEVESVNLIVSKANVDINTVLNAIIILLLLVLSGMLAITLWVPGRG